MKKTASTSVVILLVVLAMTNVASAVPIAFTLDSTQSNLGLVATYSIFTLMQQEAGSLTTSYSGMVTVDLDNPLAPSAITFLGAAVSANNSGAWLPEIGGGSEPGNPGNPTAANYGLLLPGGALGNAYAAIRGLELDMASGALSITGSAFDSAQDITATAGTFDFNLPLALGGDFGTDDISGTVSNAAASTGSYLVVGDQATLTIPLQFSIVSPDITSTFSGVLVGTATIPEPSSLLLVLLVLGSIVAIRSQR